MSNQNTIEKALEITLAVATRLYNTRYRNLIRDWDEFLSAANYMVFQKFSKYDDSIGSFAGYITMHVTFVAKSMVKSNMRAQSKVSTGTIADVEFCEVAIPEDLDWVLRTVSELSEQITHTSKAATIRATLKKQMKDKGWSDRRISETFEEIATAVTSRKVKSYAKELVN